MQRLEVSGAVRPIYGSLGVKRLILCSNVISFLNTFTKLCCLSIHPPAWNSLTPIGWITMKFQIENFSKNCRENSSIIRI